MRQLSPEALVIDGELVRGVSVDIDGEHIARITPGRGGESLPGILVPGWIDSHVHGGGGADFSSDPQVAIDAHRRRGSTTIIASLVSAPVEDMVGQLRALRPWVESGELAGIHLEGPFLAPSRAGAHDVDVLIPPTPDAVKALLDAAGESLSMVTLAPELPGALAAIGTFVEAGVRVAIGHTDADRDQTAAAFAHGATILTHAFNAMAGIHHRRPGPLPLALTDPRILLEVIADGVHLHDDIVELIRTCAPGRMALVTDAMAAASMPDGRYELGALGVNVEGGVARTVTGALAGSTLTMDLAFARARDLGWSWGECVAATSSTAATWHQWPQRGRIRAGAVADLCLVDVHGRVQNVMYRGNWCAT